MKKKIFSAALLLTMGLATAGMFVSCSDYDDDISNLQEQIDKLVTSDDLSSKITELQNSIATAKSEAIAKAETAQDVAEAAQSAATTAQKAADAAQAKADELEKNGATKAEVEAAQEAAAAAQKAADAAAADAAQAKTDAAADLAAATATMQAAVDAAQADATAALSSAADALKQIAAYKGEADAAIEKAAADATTALDKIAALEASSAKAADLEAAKSSLNKALEQIAALESASSTHATKTELADSKSALQAAIDTLASKSATKESLANAEEKIAGALTDITALKGSVSNLESTKADKTTLTDVQNKLTAAIDTLTASAATKKALQTAIDDAAKNLKSAVEKLEAADTETGKSVKEAADKASAANTLAQQAKEEADANAKTLATLQGTGEGSIAATVNAAIATVKGENLAEGVTLASLASELAKINSLIVVDDETGAGKVDLTKMSAQVDTIGNKLTAIIGEYSTMVTSVSLFAESLNEGEDGLRTNKVVFRRVTEKANVFGAVEDSLAVANKTFTFTEGRVKTYESDPIVIRVSPTTATLKPEQISLINSQGKELSDFVTCKSVEPYTKLLTSSRASDNSYNNGLWNVVFELKEGYDPEDFANAVTVKEKEDGETVKKHIKFAVAVNNIQDTDKDRRVISAYGLVVDAEDANSANSDFYVSNLEGELISIADIHNRFESTDDGTKESSDIECPKEDYVWAKSTKKYPTPATGIDEDENNVRDKETQGTSYNMTEIYDKEGNLTNELCDNRQSKACLTAGINKDINIKIDWNKKDKKVINPIAGFYVVLDWKNALESKPSELNAWESYNYTGVGTSKQAATLFEGNEGTIRINSDKAIKDIIGFRVYAVNLDGTLLDPDGRAFYVTLGNPAETGSLAGTIVATATECSSEIMAMPFELDDAAKLTNGVLTTAWEASKDNKKYGFGNDTNEDGSQTSPVFTVTFYKDAKGKELAEKAKDAKYYQFSIEKSSEYINDESYTQTVKIKDGDFVAQTITATMIKEMPKAKLVKYLSGQTEKQVFTLDPSATGYTAYKISNPMAKKGAINLENVIYVKNDLTGEYEKISDNNFTFKFAKSKDDPKTTDVVDYTKSIIVEGNSENVYMLEVASELIDNVTSHDITVTYTYTDGISTEYNKATGKWEYAQPYEVDCNSLSMTYCCWNIYSVIYGDDPSNGSIFKWTDNFVTEKGNQLTWKSNPSASIEMALSRTESKNSYNAELFSKDVATLISQGVLAVDANTLKYYTDENEINPYFSVKFDNNSAPTKLVFAQSDQQTLQAPRNDVSGYVVFECKDVFGHTLSVKLDVIVIAPTK